MSRLANILKWVIRFALFILVLVLILNNMQLVQFNFYGIYSWSLPLIVLAIIALIIGILIGITYGFVRSFELKSRIKLLRKDLEAAQKANPKPESV
jgi:uncharacterized integral membrane protein